ncbi:MAG: hypothetical protein M1819_003897 [Sarea resinae]|nr:MAG: hypothetical protein M1819_003897 [Sarea resinae]
MESFGLVLFLLSRHGPGSTRAPDAPDTPESGKFGHFGRARGGLEPWDAAYSTELTNHASHPADEGTIWFSDSNAEEKILEYLTEEVCLASETTSFCDLGTGNGHLLFALREEGEFEGLMVGLDYSEQSVELARKIAREDKGLGGEEVKFLRWDLIRNEGEAEKSSWVPEGGFDVVLDKGTFDAISLSGEVDGQGRRIVEGYRNRAEELVKEGGFLLITSCNWTEEELRTWFVADGRGTLEFYGCIEYPSFTFGGVKGQTISSVCFRKKGGGV